MEESKPKAVKTLENRLRERETALTEEEVAATRALEHFFADYYEGATLVPHPDMLSTLIEQAGLSFAQRQNVLDHAFLRCAKNAMPQVCQTFADVHETCKYSPDYTLPNFFLSWDADKKLFIPQEGKLGTFSPLLLGLSKHLELNRELSGFLYYEDAEEVLEGTDISKYDLQVRVSLNPQLVTQVILSSLAGKLASRVGDIANDLPISREAAESFLDAYPVHRNAVQYRRGLAEFLQNYDLQIKAFVPRRKPGSFRPLYGRLVQEHGLNWREGFLGKLEEPIRSRVTMLDDSLGKKGTLREDGIQLVERLGREGKLDYLRLFGGEGEDAADILLAMSMHSLTEEERKLMNDVLKNGHESLGRYMGVCRYTAPNSAVQYDARRCLQNVCGSINPGVFSGNDTLARILLNKMRQLYEQDFRNNAEETLSEIREEIVRESNPIRKDLLEKTKAHYELRQKVVQVKGIVPYLFVAK